MIVPAGAVAAPKTAVCEAMIGSCGVGSSTATSTAPFHQLAALMLQEPAPSGMVPLPGAGVQVSTAAWTGCVQSVAMSPAARSTSPPARIMQRSPKCL